jgi:hypothetical protein
MACYIFLKSLRSLEEIRKNPHVKIPHKSPSTNFQSLGKFKNPMACSRRTKSPDRPIQPARRSRLHEKYVFLFRSRLPEPAASSLCHRHAGPTCQLRRLPCAGRPRSEFPRAAAPPHRCLAPWMPLSFYCSPSSLPPLNPLQTER